MDTVSFGERLYSLRVGKGLSQSELGKLVGVSNKAVSKWETGAALPKTETLCSLAVTLGVSVEELLQGKSEEPITFESLSCKAQNIMLQEQLEQTEKTQQKSRKLYLCIISFVFLFSFIVDAALIFTGKAQAQVGEAETVTFWQKIAVAGIFSYLSAGAVTGIYAAFSFIMQRSAAVRAIALMFFWIVIPVSVAEGFVLFIPYLIYNAVKYRKETVNERCTNFNKKN